MKENKAKITVTPGIPEILITREFAAARERVFKAYTDPELFKAWVGPRRLEMNLEKFEAQSGGSWKYTSKDKDGKEYGFHGVFHEVKAPERIIQTFEYEGLPESGHVSLETAKFEALPDDRTRVSSQSLFQSLADRDGMIQSDMESGLHESFERLDELLAKELVN